MSYFFVTGCNGGYFNTLLITLQSFAVRMPGERLYVCDYGLAPEHCAFLRQQGLLLERPPGIDHKIHPYRGKAALLRYLAHAGHKVTEQDTVVWLDADLTLLDVGIRDFDRVAGTMAQKGIAVAACGNGRSVRGMCDFMGSDSIQPFEQALIFSGIDQNLPYYSVGIFFCRSPAFLRRWDEATMAVKNHTCFEQNMFTMIIHRDRVPFVGLDMDVWQAQGDTLDKIEIKPGTGGLPAGFAGPKSVKIMHTTSSAENHIQIISAQVVVQDALLEGKFKLFVKPDLFRMQIDLLFSWIASHKTPLLQAGVCTPNPEPIEGVRFIPQKQKA